MKLFAINPLLQTQIECERHLKQIERLFASHCKLTLVMRNPECEDGDLVLTRDDPELVEAAIRRLRLKEQPQLEQRQYSCGQKECDEPARYRYNWLGEELFICERHVGAMLNVAEAMGMGPIPLYAVGEGS